MNNSLELQKKAEGKAQLVLPLNHESALVAAQIGEDAWNSGNPEQVARLFSVNSEWWNRDQFLAGHENIQAYLQEKSTFGLHYRTRVNLWSHSFSRLSLRFESEWQCSDKGRWYRTRGTALVQLDNKGFIQELSVSSNHAVIEAGDRQIGFYRGVGK